MQFLELLKPFRSTPPAAHKGTLNQRTLIIWRRLERGALRTFWLISIGNYQDIWLLMFFLDWWFLQDQNLIFQFFYFFFSPSDNVQSFFQGFLLFFEINFYFVEVFTLLPLIVFHQQFAFLEARVDFPYFVVFPLKFGRQTVQLLS